MKNLIISGIVLLSILISCNNTPSKNVPLTHEQIMEKASRGEKNGWISVHLEGTPEVLGYQHGYLLASEILDLRGAMSMLNEKSTGRKWEFYRNESERLFWPNIPREYQIEIDGIVSGVNAKLGAAKIDRKDIIAMNSILEMSWYYVPWLDSRNNPDPPPPIPPGHCSAIAATGSWTKDGKIVMAHNNWVEYVIGERWNIILDIVPEKGNRIVMDALPGFIHSGDDFYINSAGIIVTETTISRYKGFDTTGLAEFVRARNAIQYSSSIDEWVAIMKEKNNGGYANDWLIGDNKTGEIARLELGLKNQFLEKTRDGYFVGANFPVNEKLIKEETVYDASEMNTSPNARKLRWEEIMKENKGKIDVDAAMKYMGDHRDTWRNKDQASGLTLCGHIDADDVGSPDMGWPAFTAAGAVQAKATDGNLAKEMSLWAIMGHPCGESFSASEFLSAHPEFNYQQEFLRDMPGQEWTLFKKQEPLPANVEKYKHPDLGKNVFVFEPGMDMKEIQSLIDYIFILQSPGESEFSNDRYAFLFKPGKYDLDIQVGYYMQVLGLGESPEDVVIAGAVRSNTTHHNSVLTNFWRGVENLTIIPSPDSANIWGVSQAAPMRRVYIRGNLQLFDKGYASGGFLADSKIDGVVTSGPQQQWFSRNTQWEKWSGGNWNMMFVGVPDAPVENWPEKPFTTIKETPLVREKPYLSFDGKVFNVKIPALKKNSIGPGWLNHSKDETTLQLNDFYIVKPGIDNSESINSALGKGKNLLFTPGIYLLDKSLIVSRRGTVIIGIGMPSLMPLNANSVIEISDIDGVSVCGLLIDAGSVCSKTLVQVGEPGSSKSHEDNPTFLYDVFFRVGGPAQGSAISCMTINSQDVFADHIWLWRADHGNGVGWDKNRCANGLIVNGDNVTVYGLFNEHFQEYQTLWNGNNGRVYFYQSEMPYDPPTADAWKHDGINGYASYKVSDNVKSHEAWGIGIYNVFWDAPVIVDNAIETPAALENKIHHKIIYWLNGNKESIVKSIINGKGGSVSNPNRKATME